jgi:hypothetical protein
MCFAWMSEQTAIISLYNINLTVFKTEAESVYCAVRTGSLTRTDTDSYLQGQTVRDVMIVHIECSQSNIVYKFSLNNSVRQKHPSSVYLGFVIRHSFRISERCRIESQTSLFSSVLGWRHH